MLFFMLSQPAQVQAPAPVIPSASVKCAATGKPIFQGHKVIYNGKSYYVCCCAACRKDMQNHPEKYFNANGTLN